MGHLLLSKGAFLLVKDCFPKGHLFKRSFIKFLKDGLCKQSMKTLGACSPLPPYIFKKMKVPYLKKCPV